MQDEKMPVTYRAEIQGMIKDLQRIYDTAEWLRDCADLDEKHYWNMVRQTLPQAWGALQRMDYKMPQGRADMIVS